MNPPRPPSSIDRPIWRLQRGERRAQATARELPGTGLELRIDVDGEMPWTQVYRGGVALGVAAAEKREALIANGWSDAPVPRG